MKTKCTGSLPVLFQGRVYPRGLCVTHSTTCGTIHRGQTWSACCWLSESSSYNSKFLLVLRRRKIPGTCLLQANDQNHRLYNLWNRKVNAFLPAYWGDWGPEIGRARARVSLLVSGGSMSILISEDSKALLWLHLSPSFEILICMNLQ